MKRITCYECRGSGEIEFCLDCDADVNTCECDESSGIYTEDCVDCDGDGDIEDEDDE